MNTITVKAQAQNQTVAEHKVVTQNGNPTVIEAADKVNYELLDESTGQAPDYLVTRPLAKVAKGIKIRRHS